MMPAEVDGLVVEMKREMASKAVHAYLPVCVRLPCIPLRWLLISFLC
jgi:hypothetical protein